MSHASRGIRAIRESATEEWHGPGVVALGGGHGLSTLLRSLDGITCDLLGGVTIADDGGSSGRLRRALGGPATGDLRRCIAALADEESSAAALERRLGEGDSHPIGNLLLRALADVNDGDLAAAAAALGRMLGARGRAVPATVDAVTLAALVDGLTVRGETAAGSCLGQIERISFDPPAPTPEPTLLAAIRRARFVFLAPGSLYTSILAVAAIPGIRDALAATTAEVVWIGNLESQIPETGGMSGRDHVVTLLEHGIRVDRVLYGYGSQLKFDAASLLDLEVGALPVMVDPASRGRHDVGLLREALRLLITGHAEPAERRWVAVA